MNDTKRTVKVENQGVICYNYINKKQLNYIIERAQVSRKQKA